MHVRSNNCLVNENCGGNKMQKYINLDLSIYELTEKYPELISIMKKLGFIDITKQVMVHSVGKIMTIPKGAKMKNIPMDKIVTALEENGFKVSQLDDSSKQEIKETISQSKDTKEERIELLKSYLKRLGTGEDLEAVKADFVANFSDVDAAEIMKAEQAILAEGTPLSEVQKLCDVHSALFHGETREEKIESAEKAVNVSVLREERVAKTKALVEQTGHPLNLFTKENEVLDTRIRAAKMAISNGTVDKNTLESIRDVSIHYAKKGDLLYPVLKVQYEISGPSDVMWTVDDEIRDELSSLAKVGQVDEDWIKRFEAVLVRIEEMIYKEANILFPNCAANFTEEEWIGIYHDEKDYAVCFGIEPESWEMAEEKKKNTPSSYAEHEIVMPGGHMNVEQLTALLNTIPLEITFVDAENINRFFNEGPKDFKRPGMAIDREVFSCHPPKVEEKVRHIIGEFRAGTLDEVPVWMEKNGKSMLVKYMAVRDKNHSYLGTLEVVQNMDFAREHFQPKKRGFEEE